MATSLDLAPLVTILSREQAVYQQLLAVADEERSAIVDRRLPELKTVLQRKQDILGKLSSLEDRRVVWLRRYAGNHGLDLSTLTLASIIEDSAPADGRVLRRLHRALLKRVERVVEVNRVTSALLEGVLRSIDASLRFLLTDDAAGQTYGAQGRLQAASPASRALLECQA